MQPVIIYFVRLFQEKTVRYCHSFGERSRFAIFLVSLKITSDFKTLTSCQHTRQSMQPEQLLNRETSPFSREFSPKI